MADERRKVWAAILYPESLPDGWMALLEQAHVPMALSPLHDADFWTADDELSNPNHRAGERKKEHYHLVIYFESLKSANQALSLLEPLGVSFVEPVESPRSYNRYLCHLDQPQKATYDVREIRRFNGAVCDISKPNPTNDRVREIRLEIMNAVRALDIHEYADLVDYADENGLEDWAWYIEHHTVYLVGYLKSRHFKNRTTREPREAAMNP